MVCNGLYLQGISAPHPESGQPLHQGYFASADFFLTHFTPKSMEESKHSDSVVLQWDCAENAKKHQN